MYCWYFNFASDVCMLTFKSLMFKLALSIQPAQNIDTLMKQSYYFWF